MLNQQKMMNNKSCENKKPGKTKGRQRIEIKQLEKKNNLHVTFTKRRNGLFKKASELCILCGAKIGIIVLSPSPREKPFSFAHPNIDIILDRYLNNIGNPAAFDDDDQDYAITDLPDFEEINKQYEESLEELEKEKKRGKEIEEAKKVGNNGGFWWDIEAIDGMAVEELEAYIKAMEELKNNLIVRANALTMANVIDTNAQADDHGFGFGFAQDSGFGVHSE